MSILPIVSSLSHLYYGEKEVYSAQTFIELNHGCDNVDLLILMLILLQPGGGGGGGAGVGTAAHFSRPAR